MTHEDIVQESKKYWQQMEAHATKPANSMVSKVHLGLAAWFCSQLFQHFLSFPPTAGPDRSQADLKDDIKILVFISFMSTRLFKESCDCAICYCFPVLCKAGIMQTAP